MRLQALEYYELIESELIGPLSTEGDTEMRVYHG
jgi:hypothetical protein